MKTTLQLLAMVLAVRAPAYAQVAPAATGPSGQPPGSLRFALRFSESATFGGSLGDSQASNFSGSAGYTNGKEHLPFSLAYGGGYSWTTGSGSFGGGLFQNLLLSQGIVGRHWSLLANDNAGYWRQAPTTGFSGVAGTGEPIGGSGPDNPPTQTILTLNTQSVNNIATANFTHALDHAISLSFGGASNLLRYPGGNGQDTDGLVGNAGLTRRMNARNSLAGQFVYSRFSYPGADYAGASGAGFTAQTDSVLFSYHRDWSRQLKTSVSAGPEWVGSSDSSVVPSSAAAAVSVLVNYRLRFETASLEYFHGVNGGAGYLPGAQSDSVSANFSREFGRKLTVGATGSYMRTAPLNGAGVTEAKYGGIQAARGLGRYSSVFASYTAVDQSSSTPLPANVLGQLYQVIAFGIGYSPREIRIKE